MTKYQFDETRAFHVDYGDIEHIIKETYSVEYEIPCMEEIGSSDHAESKEMSFNKQPLSSWDINKIEAFKNGQVPHYILNTIMQDMVNNDIIPEGNYVVSISW